MTRHSLTLVLALALVGGLAAPRAFHFSVVKSSPSANSTLEASPAKLQIWFSQVPADGVSQMKLLTAEKADVPIGKLAIDKTAKSMSADITSPLKSGAYLLSWKAAGDDGHVLNGEIKFAVALKSGS